MDFKQVNRPRLGALVGGSVLAIIVGLLLPLAAVLQISLLVPVIMLGGIVAARLKAQYGWIPVGVLAAATLVSALRFTGGQIALMLVTASLLPSLAVMVGMARRTPFFEQMKHSVVAYCAGLLLATGIAYASFGGGMVARFVDLLRSEYDRMPDAALQPMVEWVNAMLASGGMASGQRMTVDLFRGQLSGILDLMQQAYAMILPGALLSGALLSGVLTALWGNWTMARRGMATNESFVGMSGWFLPAQLSLGAVALWLVGVVMAYAAPETGETVSYTISQLAGSAFAIQALAALDRRMLRAGRTLGRRRTLIALLAVAALLLRGVGAVLAYVGVASALFGSHGAIRRMAQQRQNDHSDHNDPDE